VLFCDLVGSTALSSQMDPEDLADLIRDYQALCASAIQQLGGYVAQFLGDGVLAYFGYPEAHEDDGRRAIRAATDLVARLRVTPIRGFPLQARVGIHSGLVVMGPIGIGSSLTPLAVGEAPNIAARAQAAALPNEVVVTESTRKLAEGYFAFEALRDKPGARDGSGTRLSLFRVQGETGASSRIEAARLVGLTPFVNRTEETAYLSQAWQRVCTGSGHAILLRGEAGVGKSRLVETLRERVASEGHLVLQATSSPLEQNSALQPIRTLLRHGMRPGRYAPDGRLESWLASVGMTDGQALALFAAFLDPADPRGLGVDATMTPQRRRRLTLELLFEATRRLAAHAPVLLVVEDLHWADPTTLELLGLFVQRRPAGLFVCLTARPEFLSPWSELAEVALAPLHKDHVAEMVSHVAGRAVPPFMSELVFGRTEGVPLFVEEVTRALDEMGALGTASGTAALPAPIPSTLYDSLMSRLDRLGSAKHLAQLAAVLGRDFRPEVLAALAAADGAGAASLREDLSRLVASGLVREPSDDGPPSYSFRHALIRDAAYASLLRRERQEQHRRVAGILRDRFAAFAAEQPHVVAAHWEEGGEPILALGQWQAAGLASLARANNREAIAYLSRALKLVEELPEGQDRMRRELPLRLAIAPAFMAINGWASGEVERSCRRALGLAELLPDPSAVLPALWGLWSVFLVRGDTESALETAQRVLGIARAAGGLLLVMAHHAFGFTQFFRGQIQEARRFAEEGLDLFELGQEQAIVGHVQLSSSVTMAGFLALAAWLQGDEEASARALAKGASISDRLHHAPSRAMHLSLRAELQHWRREPQALAETATELVTLAEAEGFDFFRGPALAYRGWARAQLGDVEGGLAESREGWSVYTSSGSHLNTVHGAAGLAETLALAGQEDEALARLRVAEEDARARQELISLGEVLRLRGEILSRRGGDFRAEAEEAWATARELAQKQGAHALQSAIEETRAGTRSVTGAASPPAKIAGATNDGAEAPSDPAHMSSSKEAKSA